MKSSQTLQASVCMLNIKVHASVIGKRLNKYDLFGRVSNKKFCNSKKNMAEQLRFA